jgi:subtilisin family serine protease
MATPHASAVAALVWASRPACSNTAIRCALQKSALDLGTKGRDDLYGYGLIQAQAAVNALPATGACTCSAANE